MTYALLSVRATRELYDVVRGSACRFVDKQQTLGARGQLRDLRLPGLRLLRLAKRGATPARLPWTPP